MKVLVATRRGQGDRDDDFFHGVEGELIRMPFDACANPRCGCDHSVAGLASSRASTTFRVVDRPELDEATYRRIFLEALEREGWIALADDTDEFEEMIDWHIDAANDFPETGVLRVNMSAGASHRESGPDFSGD